MRISALEMLAKRLVDKYNQDNEYARYWARLIWRKADLQSLVYC